MKRDHATPSVNGHQKGCNVAESYQDFRSSTDGLKVQQREDFHGAKPSTYTEYRPYRFIFKQFHELGGTLAVRTGKVSVPQEEIFGNFHPVAHRFECSNPALKGLLIKWGGRGCDSDGIPGMESLRFDKSLFHGS